MTTTTTDPSAWQGAKDMAAGKVKEVADKVMGDSVLEEKQGREQKENWNEQWNKARNADTQETYSFGSSHTNSTFIPGTDSTGRKWQEKDKDYTNIRAETQNHTSISGSSIKDNLKDRTKVQTDSSNPTPNWNKSKENSDYNKEDRRHSKNSEFNKDNIKYSKDFSRDNKDNDFSRDFNRDLNKQSSKDINRHADVNRESDINIRDTQQRGYGGSSFASDSSNQYLSSEHISDNSNEEYHKPSNQVFNKQSHDWNVRLMEYETATKQDRDPPPKVL